MAAHESPDDDWLVRGDGDPREVADHYDAWAESYDADLDAWSYRAPGVVAGLLLAHQPAPGTVLDVGCGTGLAGRALRAGGYRGRLVGLDISTASLRQAEESGVYDELRPTDLTQPLPLADDAVDAVVCVGVMTYLPDVEAVWREFARVVRTPGHVVLTQREDLWGPRRCQEVVDRLGSEGIWTPVDVHGPAAYLPESTGDLADLGAYYLTASVR